MKGLTICIGSKSGVGKSTQISNLIKLHPNKYNYIKSKTTRRPRNVEDLETHTFGYTVNDFIKLNKSDIMAEYFSPKGYIHWVDIDMFSNDKINLYAIDFDKNGSGYPEFKKKYGGRIIAIYLELDENIRKNRVIERDGFYQDEPHLELDKSTFPEVHIIDTTGKDIETISIEIETIIDKEVEKYVSNSIS